MNDDDYNEEPSQRFFFDDSFLTARPTPGGHLDEKSPPTDPGKDLHMLKLTRKHGEKIVIDEGTPRQVTIIVDEINGRPHGSVRLVFDAPPDVSIWRDEVDGSVDPGDR